jgi:hypothetical protein
MFRTAKGTPLFDHTPSVWSAGWAPRARSSTDTERTAGHEALPHPSATAGTADRHIRRRSEQGSSSGRDRADAVGHGDRSRFARFRMRMPWSAVSLAHGSAPRSRSACSVGWAQTDRARTSSSSGGRHAATRPGPPSFSRQTPARPSCFLSGIHHVPWCSLHGCCHCRPGNRERGCDSAPTYQRRTPAG